MKLIWNSFNQFRFSQILAQTEPFGFRFGQKGLKPDQTKLPNTKWLIIRKAKNLADLWKKTNTWELVELVYQIFEQRPSSAALNEHNQKPIEEQEEDYRQLIICMFGSVVVGMENSLHLLASLPDVSHGHVGGKTARTSSPWQLEMSHDTLDFNSVMVWIWDDATVLRIESGRNDVVVKGPCVSVTNCFESPW